MKTYELRAQQVPVLRVRIPFDLMEDAGKILVIGVDDLSGECSLLETLSEGEFEAKYAVHQPKTPVPAVKVETSRVSTLSAPPAPPPPPSPRPPVPQAPLVKTALLSGPTPANPLGGFDAVDQLFGLEDQRHLNQTPALRQKPKRDDGSPKLTPPYERILVACGQAYSKGPRKGVFSLNDVSHFLTKSDNHNKNARIKKLIELGLVRIEAVRSNEHPTLYALTDNVGRYFKDNTNINVKIKENT